MKTFTYKKYKDCYFTVGKYLRGNNAMAISIENSTDGPITTCTVMHELGIVVNVIYSSPCDSYVRNTSETIDICEIDMEKLKEYTKE